MRLTTKPILTFPPCSIWRATFRRKDKAVLGICLGSQLLARAFGGTNQIGGAREFGWCPVSLTQDGAADPVLRVAPRDFSIFQWHDDTFGLPPGAIHLARSAEAENQAFRIGRATYGIQFHFEADRRLVGEWNRSIRRLSDRASAGLAGAVRARGGAPWPRRRRCRPGDCPRLGAADLMFRWSGWNHALRFAFRKRGKIVTSAKSLGDIPNILWRRVILPTRCAAVAKHLRRRNKIVTVVP